MDHPVESKTRVCVIMNPHSPEAAKVKKAGAAIVGTDEVFEDIKNGKIDFNRCICHTSCAQLLGKSGVARILGPKGLMPNKKYGTITDNVLSMVRESFSTTEFREGAAGAIRVTIGDLSFGPAELQKNIVTLMSAVRADMARVGTHATKKLHEVILSSTRGPGFSLNGKFVSEDGVQPQDLARGSS